MPTKCCVCGKQIDYKNFYKLKIENVSGTNPELFLILPTLCYGCRFKITKYINEISKKRSNNA